MEPMIEAAAEALNSRVRAPFDGVALFVFGDEGTIVLDSSGARVAGPDAVGDVSLIASVETFRAIFDGGLSPMAAFMTGKLHIRGNMGMAMRLGSVLT
jgi:putative sterol carrier protein